MGNDRTVAGARIVEIARVNGVTRRALRAQIGIAETGEKISQTEALEVMRALFAILSDAEGAP